VQLGPAVGAVLASIGEEKESTVHGVHENLALLEAELCDGAFKGHRFIGGDEVGILDVVMGCGSYWLSVFEEFISVRLVDADVFPLYHAWLRDFETLDEVHETIPAVDRLLKYGRGMHHMLVGLVGAGVAGAAPGNTLFSLVYESESILSTH
jgi:glutathione S-transferase